MASSSPEPGHMWQTAVSEEERGALVMQLCHELARIAGETDLVRVWVAAADFELKLWMSCPDKDSYVASIRRKLARLAVVPARSTATDASTAETGSAFSSVTEDYSSSFSSQSPLSTASTSSAATITPWTRQVHSRVEGLLELLDQQNHDVVALYQTHFNELERLVRSHEDAGLTAVDEHEKQLQQLQCEQEQARARLQQLHQVQLDDLLSQKQSNDDHVSTTDVFVEPGSSMNQQTIPVMRPEDAAFSVIKVTEVLPPTLAIELEADSTDLSPLDPISTTDVDVASVVTDRLHKMKSAYYEDLKFACDQLEDLTTTVGRLSTAKRSRASSLLASIKGLLAFLRRGSLRVKQTTMDDLDHVERTIQQRILPLVEQLKRRALNKRSSPTSSNGTSSPVDFNVDNLDLPLDVDFDDQALGHHSTMAEAERLLYTSRIDQLKLEHQQNLIALYRELSRMIKKRPPLETKARIGTLMLDIKKVLVVLTQFKPTQAVSHQRLDQVEEFIARRIKPMAERLHAKHAIYQRASSHSSGVYAGSNAARTAQRQWQRFLKRMREQQLPCTP